MGKLRTGLCIAGTAVVLASNVVVSGAAGAHGGGDGRGDDVRRVRVSDDCDPATFNLAFGPGTCVGAGTTTVTDFLGQLRATGVAAGWAFRPARVRLDDGERVNAVNTGGEFHTFTEVATFGGGCIAGLNTILGLTPVAECTPTVTVGGRTVPAAFVTSGIDAGHNLHVHVLDPGTHRFECLIHPWMRSVVTVEADDHEGD